MRRSTDGQPPVRIGMIQRATELHFDVLGPHRVIDSHGTERWHNEPASYHVTSGEIHTPATRHWVRVGVRDLNGPEPTYPAGLGADIRRLVVGRRIRLRRQDLDNREEWYLVGPFGSLGDAQAFRRGQARPGDCTLLTLPDGRASGWAMLNGERLHLPIRVEPSRRDDPQILLRNVLVGIEFHWQHYANEHLRGVLEIAAGNDGTLVAVNELPLEQYLISVNSSEMTPDSPIELLKAQTVAARSTVFATIGKHHLGDPFDLCADDHCQCYYGADREREASRVAAESTCGEVLLSGTQVCDARYSKICGGIIEDYRFVWENREVAYLVSGIDGTAQLEYPADDERKARRLIDSSPDVFCNVELYELPLSLRERCEGLFRWQVRYKREELERLLAERVGVHVGKLLDLVPLERGHSGRIVHLEVVGSEGRVVLGKELEIRRALSETHLYSSCFYVQKEERSDSLPEAFILKGAGWGHGVGLCQVGATVMAMQGYDYRQILKHYYKHSRVERVY